MILEDLKLRFSVLKTRAYCWVNIFRDVFILCTSDNHVTSLSVCKLQDYFHVAFEQSFFTLKYLLKMLLKL